MYRSELSILPDESSDISPKEALMARTIIALLLCVESAKQALFATTTTPLQIFCHMLNRTRGKDTTFEEEDKLQHLDEQLKLESFSEVYQNDVNAIGSEIWGELELTRTRLSSLPNP